MCDLITVHSDNVLWINLIYYHTRFYHHICIYVLVIVTFVIFELTILNGFVCKN